MPRSTSDALDHPTSPCALDDSPSRTSISRHAARRRARSTPAPAAVAVGSDSYPIVARSGPSSDGAPTLPAHREIAGCGAADVGAALRSGPPGRAPRPAAGHHRRRRGSNRRSSTCQARGSTAPLTLPLSARSLGADVFSRQLPLPLAQRERDRPVHGQRPGARRVARGCALGRQLQLSRAAAPSTARRACRSASPTGRRVPAASRSARRARRTPRSTPCHSARIAPGPSNAVRPLAEIVPPARPARKLVSSAVDPVTRQRPRRSPSAERRRPGHRGPSATTTASGRDSAPASRTSACDVPLIARPRSSHGASAARSASATTRMSSRGVARERINPPVGCQRALGQTQGAVRRGRGRCRSTRAGRRSPAPSCGDCCHAIRAGRGRHDPAGRLAAVGRQLERHADVDARLRILPAERRDPVTRACSIEMRGSATRPWGCPDEPGQFPAPAACAIEHDTRLVDGHVLQNETAEEDSWRQPDSNVLRGEEGLAMCSKAWRASGSKDGS